MERTRSTEQSGRTSGRYGSVDVLCRGALAAGAGFGLGGAALWAAVVAVAPPVPGNVGLATVVVLASMALAASWAGLRGLLVTVLTAGIVSSLSILATVAAIADVVPDRWVPQLVTVAVGPAAAVRESRSEMVDPYFALAFLAVFLVAVMVVTTAPPVSRRMVAWASGGPVQGQPAARVRQRPSR
jgi:hypothetical protein